MSQLFRGLAVAASAAVGSGWTFFCRLGSSCSLADLGAGVPLLQRVAAHHQHRHDHRDIPHSVPDPEHPESPCGRDSTEAGRVDKSRQGGQERVGQP